MDTSRIPDRSNIPLGLTKEIVDWLAEEFPNRLPDNINITSQELGRRIGHQEVIQCLKGRLEEQTPEDETELSVL